MIPIEFVNVLPRPLTRLMEIKVIKLNIKRYSISACPDEALIFILDFIIIGLIIERKVTTGGKQCRSLRIQRI